MKNKRSFENTLIQPREQMKVILLFVGCAVLFLGGFTMTFLVWMRSTLQELSNRADVSPALARSIEASLANSMYITTSIAVILAIIMVVAGFALSHRLYGPTVQIKRMILRLSQGEYKTRGRLRKGDAFHDVMNSLNALADELDRKHGAMKEASAAQSDGL